jgi:hypothetical protein
LLRNAGADFTAGADLQSVPHNTGKARITNPRQHNGLQVRASTTDYKSAPAQMIIIKI